MHMDATVAILATLHALNEAVLVGKDGKDKVGD